MNSDKFFTSLHKLFSQGRVSHVISVLRNNIASASAAHPEMANLAVRLDRIEDTYARMRRYLLDGVDDPALQKMYADILDDLDDTARSYLFILNENRLDPFFADYRLQKVRNRKLADLYDELKKNDYRALMADAMDSESLRYRAKGEEAVGNIFLKIWSLPPWADDERKTVAEILSNPEAPFTLRAQSVSALLLGLLKFYDPGKFALLLDFYSEADDERLAARALTAIVLVIARHGASVMGRQAIRGRLEVLADSILTYTRLRDVVNTLIRTRDTDRVSREVSEAFNSTMKELTPEMLEKLRREGLAVDTGETGMNPEWEKLMKNKSLEEKMKAINDMQLEGMDVMMQTFARLKSFPFFNTLPNWFLPFSPQLTAVAPLFDSLDPEAFSTMTEATDMCASDRYSFAFGILRMPDDRRRDMAAHLSAQLESVRDLLKDRDNVGRKPEFATEALLFSRDLYRFAKLYPKRRDFHDPFESALDFLSLSVLGKLLDEDEIKVAAADFYFRHAYYPLALSLYENIVASSGAERHIFERIGFCHQMQGDIDAALRNYEKADLFSSDSDRSSSWLIRKLALCNKLAGNYAKAADYYAMLLERNPDDMGVEFHLGNVQLRAGNIKEGMEHLSKVHYLAPDQRNYTRSYIRGLAMRGSLDDAAAAVTKLIDGGAARADNADLRLAGHIAFMAGNLKKAADYYGKASSGFSEVEYRAEIEAELGTLAPYDELTLHLVLDSLHEGGEV